MPGLFWKLYWKLSGWKIVGQFPYHHKKMVMIAAPHTHWHDLLLGFSGRNELNIQHAKFLGKKELFVGPLGWFLRKMGGTAIDRSGKLGKVEQVASLFESHETFLLGMAPEGTRKRVDKFRTGFYHIAKQAKVPILPIGFDYEHKHLVLGVPFFTSDDEAADMKKLIRFFSAFKGKKPDFDLRHLNDAANN